MIQKKLEECTVAYPLVAEFVIAIEMLIEPEIRMRDFYLNPIQRIIRSIQHKRAVTPSGSSPPKVAVPNVTALKPKGIQLRRSPSSTDSKVKPPAQYGLEEEISQKWREMWQRCIAFHQSASVSVGNTQCKFIGPRHQKQAKKWMQVSKQKPIPVVFLPCSSIYSVHLWIDQILERVFEFSKNIPTHEEMCEQSLVQLLNNQMLIEKLRKFMCHPQRYPPRKSASSIHELSPWFARYTGVSCSSRVMEH